MGRSKEGRSEEFEVRMVELLASEKCLILLRVTVLVLPGVNVNRTVDKRKPVESCLSSRSCIINDRFCHFFTYGNARAWQQSSLVASTVSRDRGNADLRMPRRCLEVDRAVSFKDIRVAFTHFFGIRSSAHPSSIREIGSLISYD